jgi:hypothetical protein
VAQLAIERLAMTPWVSRNSGASCDGGLGNDAIALSLSAAALVTGTWQVMHGEL